MVCRVCQKTFESKSSKAVFCSDFCKAEERKGYRGDGVEGHDYLVCPLTGAKREEFTILYAKMLGFKDLNEYKEKAGLTSVKCQKKRDQIKGSNNPAYQHDGKFSVLSMKFHRGNTEECIAEVGKKISEGKKAAPQNNRFAVEHWVEQYGEEDGRRLYSEFQTRGKDWYIKNHGEVFGPILHADRIDRWMATMDNKTDLEKDEITRKKMSGYGVSGIEKTIGEKIKSVIPDLELQFVLKRSNGKRFIYDFKYKNKVVEFHGDMWHMNPSLFDINDVNRVTNTIAENVWQKDAEKLHELTINDIELMVVWESDYKKDKEATIQKCIRFLTQSTENSQTSSL